MTPAPSDPILGSLRALVWRLRWAKCWSMACPGSAGICMAAAAATVLQLGEPESVALASIAAIGLVFAIAWKRALAITGFLAAARADYELRLPSTFSAFQEYAPKPSPGAFQQAHLEAARAKFPDGIPWRPRGSDGKKSAVLLVAIVVWVAAALVLKARPGEEDSTSQIVLSQDDQAVLARAAELLRHSEQQELAVALESYAKLPGLVSAIEKERFLRRIRDAQRALNAEEGRVAGEFLGGLLEKSGAVSATSEALAELLKRGQWDKARDLAGMSSAGSPSAEPDIERKILDALGKNSAEARATSEGAEPAAPASSDLTQRLAALARSLALEAQRQEMESYSQTQEALAGIAQKTSPGQPEAGPDQETRTGKALPILGAPESAKMEQAARIESVTPQVTAGHAARTSVTMETQDTGISTLPPRATYLPEDQHPAAPVPRYPLLPSHRDIVRAYFEKLEKQTPE